MNPNPEPKTRSQISVLVVDDSAFMRATLSRMINSDPALFVVGTADNGREALERIATLDPDVVTLDVVMPGLGGLETLRCIMAQSPRPVIMVSSTTVENAEVTFSALGAGAFDYVPKELSSASLDIAHISGDLIAKIKAAARSRLSRGALPVPRKPPQAVATFEVQPFPTVPAIVAIGASTGGPKALEEILPLLPGDLSVPILIVQHMPPGFTAAFARRLNTLCSIRVREAQHQEIIQPGVAYIAPAGIHLTVQRPTDSRAIISLTSHPDDHPHIPSVDVMMESVAAQFRSLAMGIILTGMGSDGALGMKAIHRLGGFTVGQDEATCIVYSMPRACAEGGILRRVVPPAEIPAQILQATRYRKRA
jgi:two-component system chemotaxis response regulator CheB